MINLKKHDAVADAVKEILQQEALKGNQTKIDANHNNKIDAEDFKILRGKKKVEEELKGNQDKIDANHNGKIDGGDFKLLRAKKKMKEEADRTEDTLTGKLKAKKGDDVGPGADFKSSKVKLKAEEVESLEEKNWIAGAIKHPGAETAAAKKAGMSTQAYAEKHKHDSGKAGKRARLALTLKHMKEKLEEPVLDELINEVMAKDASAGDYIHDFIHSDNPKFAGKSKAKRKEMALAAYYSKKNEETVQEGLKDVAKNVAKKAFKALTGGSDKDHLDRLKKDMYKKEEVEQITEEMKTKTAYVPYIHTDRHGNGFGGFDVHYSKEHEAQAHVDRHGHTEVGGRKGWVEKHEITKHPVHGGWVDANMMRRHGSHNMHEETVAEGWDDMVKDAKEKVKSGPKPNGGSGKKEGSAYGGSKQKEKPEQEVKEAKNPMMDAGVGSQPDFATDMTKPMKVAQHLAKKSLGRMRNEMLGKTGTSE
jgi:hypothetical protein